MNDDFENHPDTPPATWEEVPPEPSTDQGAQGAQDNEALSGGCTACGAAKRYATGLCRACYQKGRLAMRAAAGITCANGCARAPVARGLCNVCYGTERKRAIKRGGWSFRANCRTCNAKRLYADGLCLKCYGVSHPGLKPPIPAPAPRDSPRGHKYGRRISPCGNCGARDHIAARGLCWACYNRGRRHNVLPPIQPKPTPEARACDGCQAQNPGKLITGLCGTCYQKAYRERMKDLKRRVRAADMQQPRSVHATRTLHGRDVHAASPLPFSLSRLDALEAYLATASAGLDGAASAQLFLSFIHHEVSALAHAYRDAVHAEEAAHA